jgi:hypothetical protein
LGGDRDDIPEWVFQVWGFTSRKHQAFFHVNCTFGPSFVDVRCHCRKLEREGIPCSHAFCVLKYARIESIPPCCVVWGGLWMPKVLS